jgi:hypothetical protein
VVEALSHFGEKLVARAIDDTAGKIRGRAVVVSNG